jgi:hypothetical protein
MCCFKGVCVFGVGDGGCGLRCCDDVDVHYDNGLGSAFPFALVAICFTDVVIFIFVIYVIEKTLIDHKCNLSLYFVTYAS